jgi:hypothetical protein
MKNSNPQRIAVDIAPVPSALMIAFPQAVLFRSTRSRELCGYLLARGALDSHES